MSTLMIPQPATEESAPFYHGYIAEVRGGNIAEQMTAQLEELEHLFSPVNDRTVPGPYAPGKWSVKEVLGHLADTERIFAYRLLRIARGDATPLAFFDENAYVPAGRFDQRPLESLLAELRAVRQSTLALVEGIPADCWMARGQASGKLISARALAYIILGHAAHHLRVLRERYGMA
jgi:hypothetical protein